MNLDVDVAEMERHGMRDEERKISRNARPLPSTASAAGCPTLFGSFVGTMGLSDFPCPCIAGMRSLTFPARTRVSSLAEHGISRFSRMEFPHMLRVSDCAGSGRNSPLTSRPVLPSAPKDSVGTPEYLISQLNTWPACAPVNASPPPLGTVYLNGGQEPLLQRDRPQVDA